MTAFRIDARGDARSKIYTPPTVGPTQGVPNEEYGSLNGIAYEFDYFSGTQMGVYFGDLLVDDIGNLTREEGATWPHPSDSSWQSYRRGDQYPPFDIWLLYGDISNKAANNTIRKIIRCDIMGQEQVIDATGEPILERYQFIARNLV
jgi:hypothetical protein